jgi:carotenoid cleavage dioxygenase-like enzyme
MPLPETLLTAPLQDLDLVVRTGTVPEGLHGEMVISAPVVDTRLGYQLFGFGALLRISLTPGTFGAAPDAFALRHRVLDTPVHRLHERARERFHGGLLGFDTPWGYPNMANTAPLPMDGRLFATWDVGRPVEVDPVTLGFLGEVGHQVSWGRGSFGGHQALPQVFSTAHPVVDHERGCLWTVKLVPAAGGLQPIVVRYDGDGTEVRTWPVEGATVVGSMHTVSQTRDWLVLADSGNFKADMDEIFGGSRTVQIDDTVPVYFVRKEHLEATRPGDPVRCTRAEFGPTTGHYYACWEDTDGVRILFEHMDLMDLGYRLLPGDVDIYGNEIDPRLHGFYQMSMKPQTVSEWRFDPATGRGERFAVRTGTDTFNLQLSAQDWSPAGQSDPTHHHVVFQGFRGGALARRVLDVYDARIDRSWFPAEDQPSTLVTFARGDLGISSRYAFPSTGDLPTSPTFVPRRDGVPGGGDGWVVVPVLSDDGFRIEVFDAADVGRGPVVTLAPAQSTPLPFFLHSIWMPEAAPAPSVERLRFADEVGERELAKLDDEARRLVLEVAAELDEELAR